MIGDPEVIGRRRGYNPDVTEAGITIEFEVEEDESGGYNASARVGSHSLITQGDDLDELRAMIEDLLKLFTETSGQRVASYTFRFSPAPIAA